MAISASQCQEESRHQTVQKNKTQRCREDVGTSTRAVACALTSKPQPLLLLHPTGAVASTVKDNKVRSFSGVTVSSIVEVTMDNQQSVPGSAALRRSGTPGAPEKTTSHNCCDTNTRKENSE